MTIYKARTLALCAAMFLLAGCAGSGPHLAAIMGSASAQKIDRTDESPYVLVDIGRAFAEKITASYPEFVSSMPQAAPEPFVIGVSDVLNISIVSSNDAGFIDFTQSAIAPLSTTTLPSQEVATDGTVMVPQLGRMKAAGRSVQSFESLLTRRLSDVLINPTAIVQVLQRQSATVNVIGRVSGGSYPLNLSNRRLLDVIGVAGGPTSDTEGLIVTLNRRGVQHRAALEDVYANKKLNVFLRSGDLISIEPEQTRVRVLGATAGTATLDFEEFGVTLIDVISQAGGLISPRAARKGVFVYREAPLHQLHALGADLSAFPGAKTIPTVFRIDLTDPNSLFTSQNFRMMDNDIVYVADSIGQQISDFFGATSPLAPNPAVYVQDATLGN